jgi:hypothetical protein
MKKYAKVDGHPNLLRDLDTNAIINTDKISSDNYTIVKQKKEEENKRISHIEDDIHQLKTSIDEIKFLLKDILNGSR